MDDKKYTKLINFLNKVSEDSNGIDQNELQGYKDSLKNTFPEVQTLIKNNNVQFLLKNSRGPEVHFSAGSTTLNNTNQGSNTPPKGNLDVKAVKIDVKGKNVKVSCQCPNCNYYMSFEKNV